MRVDSPCLHYFVLVSLFLSLGLDKGLAADPVSIHQNHMLTLSNLLQDFPRSKQVVSATQVFDGHYTPLAAWVVGQWLFHTFALFDWLVLVDVVVLEDTGEGVPEFYLLIEGIINAWFLHYAYCAVIAHLGNGSVLVLCYWGFNNLIDSSSILLFAAASATQENTPIKS